MPAVGASDGETKRSGKRLKLVKLVIRAVERDRRASMAVDDAREAKVVSTSTVVKAFRSVCTVSTFLPTVFFGPKIVVKNRGKTTSTFYHDSRFHRTIVRKSSSKTLERGTGFEPATSTLGRLSSGVGHLPLSRRLSLVISSGNRSRVKCLVARIVREMTESKPHLEARAMVYSPTRRLAYSLS